MNDATHGADNIRKDINALAQRYAVIDRDEDCGVLIVLVLSGHSFSYHMQLPGIQQSFNFLV